VIGLWAVLTQCLTMPGRVYNRLHDHSIQQGGYLTTREARELGVDPHRLEKMKQRGLLEAVSRGVFRFADMPAGPLEQYIAAR
jgi:predicted transcriptional regulator of viral defense system